MARNVEVEVGIDMMNITKDISTVEVEVEIDMMNITKDVSVVEVEVGIEAKAREDNINKDIVIPVRNMIPHIGENNCIIFIAVSIYIAYDLMHVHFVYLHCSWKMCCNHLFTCMHSI